MGRPALHPGFGVPGGPLANTATVNLYTTIPSTGPYAMALAYTSALSETGLGLKNNQDDPDQSHFQDNFNWSITFDAVDQTP